jgi:hypothetical protein
MRAVKYALIALLLLAGSSFFYAGVGVDIPFLEYNVVVSYGVLVSIALFLAAVLTASWHDDLPSGTRIDRT